MEYVEDVTVNTSSPENSSEVTSTSSQTDYILNTTDNYVVQNAETEPFTQSNLNVVETEPFFQSNLIVAETESFIQSNLYVTDTESFIQSNLYVADTESFIQSNLNVAETITVNSMDDSIIYIDGGEALDLTCTPLNHSATSLPVTIPLSSDESKSSSVGHSNDDDDFCIVYEKKASPSEVQILENYVSSNTQAKKLHRRSQNPRPSNQYSSSTTEQINPPIEDSICIVESTVAQAAPSDNQNLLRTLQQFVAETEKKKRKIECTICFDGPDEIDEGGKSLVSTVCGHIFCSDCITLAIKTSKQCPQCRKRLTMRQFHVLYL